MTINSQTKTCQGKRGFKTKFALLTSAILFTATFSSIQATADVLNPVKPKLVVSGSWCGQNTHQCGD
jgi:hypothetical protein